jgi:hypothetical protein
MYIIVCLDEKNGMMFNNRRQSRDKVVLSEILKICDGSTLWMGNYSIPLFADSKGHKIKTDDSFLSKATDGEYCFVENVDIAPYQNKIEKIYIFKWNRHYPSDFWFNLDYGKWSLLEVKEFPGSSHEKITLEVYKP